jgi:N-methylhydantoinase A/oxoprolinase/acetone carboxylase beta subunit
MILGLDVGGTQTDTVLIEGTDVVVETKTPTGDDLLSTLRDALEKTLADVDPAQISRMAFSTTMATNAIAQDSLDHAGMIVSAGPGMNPDWFSVGPSYHVVEGCLDHQGLEALPLKKESVLDATALIREKGINTIGVVGKFSVRNPAHEKQIKAWVGNEFSHVALGHHVSGILNFPRRINTTYLNAALYGLHDNFSSSLTRILDEKGLHAPRFLLKPDGGTMELDKTILSPARTAQSGPAASVMGSLALDGCKGTTLVLDIGGTTTDMSVVLDGVPLLAPYGIRLGPFRTLIRSLLTRSIGLGGDSEVRTGKDGRLIIGPLRKGMPVAFGGPAPTPTDAMITLGLLDTGNREAAKEAMENLGRPFKWDAPKTAVRVLEHMAMSIAEAAKAFLSYLNSRPVYTIHEVLHEEKIEPESVVIIGGPAPQIADYVGKALDLPHRVPGHFAVANAVGAAVARVTSELTLQADTERGTVVIPEANIQNNIEFGFSMDDAMSLAGEVLKEQAVEIGADPTALDISVTEKQVFNMIRGYSRTGRNIRLRMCITPGLISEWK